MAAKKSSENSGGKKVFSVPVGKLRIKYATPGRSGSNSGSGSVSAHRHKLLLRNNRELARSLSVQKERYRMMMIENLDLKTMIHEIKLEVLGLEKKLRDSSKSNSAYRESLKGHLWNVIRCSASLAESLNLAVSVDDRISTSEDLSPKNCVSREPSASVGGAPPLSTCSPIPVAQPQKQRVNPMISGHTIRYPTISLKRVVMDNENKTADKRKEPTEEEGAENDEDVSQNMNSSRESHMGLSTCLEEDEKEETDISEDDSGAEKMESDEEEDSIRRKIVSFRCSVKDGNRSDCEVGATSGSINTSRNMTRERSSPERRTSCESETPKLSMQVKSKKITVRDNCGRRTPFVALNDVGKLLQNSRSINVLKIPLVDHNPKSGEMEIGVPDYASENENDKFPKQSLANKADVSACGESARSHLSMENDEDKGGSSDSKIVGRGKSLEGTDKPEAKDNTSSCAIEDPLEGTSWMYLNNFSGKRNKKKHKASQKLPKHKRVIQEEATTAKNEADKNIVQKTVNLKDKCETVNSVVEETSNVQCDLLDQQTKVNESNTRKTSDDDLDGDVGDLSCSFSSKNSLIVRSTPVHKEKQTQICCELAPTAVCLESPRKSSSDYTLSSSDSSSKGDSSHAVDEEGEKELCASPYDSKINGTAFVTVRVRRLVLPDLSPVNDLEGTEVDSSLSHPTPHHPQETDDNLAFLGFDGVCVPDECSNVQAFKQTISSVTDEYLVSDIGFRNSGSSSAYSFGISCDSMPMGSESCDSLDDAGVSGGRPRRKAAPKELKEASLAKKLRRETTGPKKKTSKRKVRRATKAEC